MTRSPTARGLCAALALVLGGTPHLCIGEEAARSEPMVAEVGHPGVVLIQRSPANLNRRVASNNAQAAAASAPTSAASAADNGSEAGNDTASATWSTPTSQALSALQAQVSQLTFLVQSMQHTLSDQISGCCNCGQPSTSPSLSTTPTPPTTAPPTRRMGMCAAYGDPHFTTFDGAYTILNRAMVMWVVKSQNIWVQAIARETTGNLMGFAVGGPFMKNHTLVLYNGTMTGGPVDTLSAMFDGQPILTQPDSEYSEPFLLWAARRSDWVPTLHDQKILEIKEVVHFDVGPWVDRFKSKPKGGIYLFKLPEDMAVTATGVDFMSAVFEMAKQDSQTGYCGNFNGNADDDFDPPLPGSVPKNLVPAWNKPIGEDLGDVPDSMNLFMKFDSTKALLRINALLAQQSATRKEDPNKPNCSTDAGLRAKAEAECKGIPRDHLREACILDFCLTGRSGTSESAAAIGLMEEIVNARNLPVFVGHGECKDSQGRAYRPLRSEGVRNREGCQELLKALASQPGVTGIRGAQFQVMGTCEILVDQDSAASLRSVLPTPAKGGWKEAHTEDVQTGEGEIDGVIANSDSLAWSCWRLN